MNKDHVAEFFRDDEFGVSDEETRERTVNYWSDVYGFSMNVMKQMVIRDAQILKINAEDVCTDMFKFKLIDCLTVGTSDVAKFEAAFALHVEKDTYLTGIASSFDCFFNQAQLDVKSMFSTSPFHTATHWQQTLFQFEERVFVKQGSTISGKITCYKNEDYQRSYIVYLHVFDKVYKYKIE